MVNAEGTMFLKDPLIVRFWPCRPLLEGWVGFGRWIGNWVG